MIPTLQRVLPFALLAAVVLSATSHLDAYTLSGRKWAIATVNYYINPKSVSVSASAATSAIQQAAAVWSQQSTANIALRYAGTTSGSSLQMNYKNEVFFRNASSGSAVAVTHYWYNSKNLFVDTDIVFYEGSYKFYVASGCTKGVYVENVAVHEFGHALGLRHSSVSGATMQSSMPGYCDRSQLTLATDDIAGIKKIYPPL
jgi:predicted Zn-dependent protease